MTWVTSTCQRRMRSKLPDYSHPLGIRQKPGRAIARPFLILDDVGARIQGTHEFDLDKILIGVANR